METVAAIYLICKSEWEYANEQKEKPTPTTDGTKKIKQKQKYEWMRTMNSSTKRY